MIVYINREGYDITLPTTCLAFKKLVGLNKDAFVTHIRLGEMAQDYWTTNKRFTEANIKEGDRFIVLPQRMWLDAWERQAYKAAQDSKLEVHTPCGVCGYYDHSFRHECDVRISLMQQAELRGWPFVKGPGSMRGEGKSHWKTLMSNIENPMLDSLFRQVVNGRGA